jgi:hypothetical protein
MVALLNSRKDLNTEYYQLISHCFALGITGVNSRINSAETHTNQQFGEEFEEHVTHVF